jgi:CDP-diacylglycerol pyrophosphatase
MNPKKKRILRIAVFAGIGAIVIAAAAFAVMRALADPNALWSVVSQCAQSAREGRSARPCSYVDEKHDVAILRSIGGREEFLAVPIIRVSGIEDPQILDPHGPNYWASAWRAAKVVLPLQARIRRQDIGLAINSVESRTQNQLHIHISCIQHAVATALDHDRIGPTWSAPLPFEGERYRVIRVEARSLDSIDPFLMLSKRLGPSGDMGLHTLVVTGAVWNRGNSVGFYVLDDYSHDTPPGHDAAHGEDLLDESCAGPL